MEWKIKDHNLTIDIEFHSVQSMEQVVYDELLEEDLFPLMVVVVNVIINDQTLEKRITDVFLYHHLKKMRELIIENLNIFISI